MDERKKEKDKIDSCCSKNKLISRTAKKSRGLCRILVRNNQQRTQQISWGYIKRVLDSGNYSSLNQLIIPYQYPEGEILVKKIYKKDDGHNSIINHDITHYLWHDFNFQQWFQPFLCVCCLFLAKEACQGLKPVSLLEK